MKLTKIKDGLEEAPYFLFFGVVWFFLWFIDLFYEDACMDYTFKVEIIREGEDNEITNQAISAPTFDRALKKLRTEVRKLHPMDTYYPLIRVLWFEV